ncbi:MAG: hypothetical protein JXA42_19290 [Anaerolineales bacterium]|nr:hypothetical protein [Anaerolineales bacterium]
MCLACGIRPQHGHASLCKVCLDKQPPPVLSLHDPMRPILEELSILRDVVENISQDTQTTATEGQPAKQELNNVLHRLQAIEQQVGKVRFRFIYPELDIYLESADKVDRLNELEREAGIWLGLATLFLGGLVQLWMDSRPVNPIVVMATIAFGAAAAWSYYRAKRAADQMRKKRERLASSERPANFR